MKKVVLLILVGMVSVWAEGVLNWAKHPGGQKYYSARPVSGLKQNKLKWNEFARQYPKSWTYDAKIGWMLVDTPPVEEIPVETPIVTIPLYIPPIRNGRTELIIESPTLSSGPTKK